MVILDSDVIIDHLRQRKAGETYLIKIRREISETLAISVISLQELYAGKSTRIRREEKYLLDLLSNLKILDYKSHVAKLAGTIVRDTKFPVRLADAAIAATTILHKASLFTLNKRHFEGIKDLKLLDV